MRAYKIIIIINGCAESFRDDSFIIRWGGGNIWGCGGSDFFLVIYLGSEIINLWSRGGGGGGRVFC